MTDFFRFPHTPHLAWLGEGLPRDDKVFSPNQVAALLADNVVVEEKLDGANLGLSLAPNGSLRAQNRGQYLAEPHAGQFARLPAWLAQHGEPLRAVLRAELDAYYAKLYGLTRDELRYILDPADIMGEDYPSETFRVLKNKEMREFGEYRTQRLVLATWDKLETGELH